MENPRGTNKLCPGAEWHDWDQVVASGRMPNLYRGQAEFQEERKYLRLVLQRRQVKWNYIPRL